MAREVAYSRLSQEDAAARLLAQGRNEIIRQRPPSALALFSRQFKSSVIWLLIGAAVLAGILEDWFDSAAILAIVLINAGVGFFQEFRAERALAALRAMTAPRARVIRGGQTLTVAASEIVVDDVLVLEEGDLVAADALLLQAHNLSANEAALTGESLPVPKRVGEIAKDAPLAERSNAVFSGTAIARGTGVARVCATGMQTELGKIAHLLAEVHSESTPLQKRLARLSRTLLWLCLGCAAVVAVVAILQGLDWVDVMLIGVSLAVAAVPEGLPAIVTLALALGVHRMAKIHVLVRKLASVETLGCATTICSDKTGTLTTGVMAVRELWGPDEKALLYAAAACCDAELQGERASGDPTEIALLRAAAHRQIHRPDIEKAAPRLEVTPFESERKRMSILREDGVLYVKGAPEVLLQLSGGAQDAAAANQDMAARGLRVLAVATGASRDESNLKLLGLIGMADPPREEVKEALRVANEAGIRTVMITGDHPATATAIARELGLLGANEPPEGRVYARVTAGDKLKIVHELKQKGEVVAMTGDGVNDAPALKEAHIGIAMGKTGTEVTRESADLVLTDDNYAHIVNAVAEGRGIYANIRKALVYIMGGNAGELLIMFASALIGWPLPLLPIHLLWINLIADGPPALTLVVERSEEGAMKEKPRAQDEPILGRREWTAIFLIGAIEALCSLGMFRWALPSHGEAAARAMAFSVLAFAQLFRTFAARSERKTFWQLGALSNWKLLLVVVFTGLAQLAILRVPWMQDLFKIGPLSWLDVGLCVLIGLIPVTLIELWKLARPQAQSRTA